MAKMEFRQLSSAFGRLARKIKRIQRKQGFPPGLSPQNLDGICRSYLNDNLLACSYVHLSGWKENGTFRLRLVTSSKERLSLIFKNEIYTTAFVPALEGLPIHPGRSEFVVYGLRHQAIREFLPESIWCQEIADRHYQYILEDLAGSYRRFKNNPEEILLAVEWLCRIQDSMQESLNENDKEKLIKYDQSYSKEIIDYAQESLEEYKNKVNNNIIDELCCCWASIRSLRQKYDVYYRDLKRPIHGDFNKSNILVPLEASDKPKMLDWEWAGIGVPHADLAALLKGTTPELERMAIERFARHRPDIDVHDHRQVFAWCQIERRLFDAAFAARQELRSHRRTAWLEPFVRQAATDVLRVAHSMQ